MEFKLTSKYEPTGDQPEAIRELTDGIRQGDRAQVLLGVTGSGKTFTVANVIQQVQVPTLVLSHNKTLAAQLYEEMKAFFPENAVEYYVSYYDYYQPEAYLPTTDTYIEKDLAINDEIEKLRLRAVSALLSGRKDIIVVSSVSCIYGMGGPTAMQGSVIRIEKGADAGPQCFLASVGLLSLCSQRSRPVARQLPCEGRHRGYSHGLFGQCATGVVVGRRDRCHRGVGLRHLPPPGFF